MARASSRSKPRRFGISSRKSVSAAASSSATRRSAPLSLLRRSRMVALTAGFIAPLAPPAADAPRRAGSLAGPLAGPLARLSARRLGATLERPALVFGPFLAFAALALFGFFMGILLNEGLRGFTKTGYFIPFSLPPPCEQPAGTANRS